MITDPGAIKMLPTILGLASGAARPEGLREAAIDVYKDLIDYNKDVSDRLKDIIAISKDITEYQFKVALAEST